MKLRKEYSVLFMVVVIAAFLYYATQQYGLTRQEVIEIILIAVFLVVAYAFATLAAGRKDGDKQIIADLQKENKLLSEKYFKLVKKHDELMTNITQWIKKDYKLGKLGNRTNFVRLNEADKG